jgi:hypothetical protein
MTTTQFEHRHTVIIHALIIIILPPTIIIQRSIII